MNDIKNTLQEMEGLAASLDGGASGLDGVPQAPFANTGESIGAVAEALGRLLGASAGVSGGLHQLSEEVRAAREDYLRSDGSAVDGMPQPRRERPGS